MAHTRFALRNFIENRTYIAARIVALAGGFAASSCIFLMRYALDYGGYLPNADGLYPKLALRSYDSFFVATVVYHVDIALLYYLGASMFIFAVAVLAVLINGLSPTMPVYTGRNYLRGDDGVPSLQ